MSESGRVQSREFFGVTIKEPDEPGESSLAEWLWANGYRNDDDLRIQGIVHAWLTSWQEAGGGVDCTEPLSELERK